MGSLLRINMLSAFYLLLSLLVLPLFSPTVGVVAQETNTSAVVTTNNPHLLWEAIMPDTFNTSRGGILGTVAMFGSLDGTGVEIDIALSNFPDYDTAGPFSYHIHENMIDTDGNCSSAGAHLDPYDAGDTTPCDFTQPQTCQVGDLSGKHGKINSSEPFTANYKDLYASTLDSSPAYIGHFRSLVIHAANGTRIACANLTQSCQGSFNSNHGYNLTHYSCPRFQRTSFTEATWLTVPSEEGVTTISTARITGESPSLVANPIATPAVPLVSTVTVTETLTTGYPAEESEGPYTWSLIYAPESSSSSALITATPTGYGYGYRQRPNQHHGGGGSGNGGSHHDHGDDDNKDDGHEGSHDRSADSDATYSLQESPTQTLPSFPPASTETSVLAQMKRAAATNSGERFIDPWTLCRVAISTWLSFLWVWLFV